MIEVVIGTEANQRIPQKVLEYSIRKHATKPVRIRAVEQSISRVGGTNFGFVRFGVPELMGWNGKAIYLDADQLVLSDIHELADALPDGKAVALVTEPVGHFGDKPVPRANQSSVMVMDCGQLRDWDTSTLFANVIGNREPARAGSIHYRDFMMLSWMDSSRIASLDPGWNHFNIVRPDTRLVHFSHVRTQPWKAPAHPLARFWAGWLAEAVAAGAVGRRELLREIAAGHVHWRFLPAVLSPGSA